MWPFSKKTVEKSQDTTNNSELQKNVTVATEKQVAEAISQLNTIAEQQRITEELVFEQQKLIKGLNFGIAGLQDERDNLQALMAGLMIDNGLTEFVCKKEVFEQNINDGVEIIYENDGKENIKVYLQLGKNDDCEDCSEKCNCAE